MNRLLLVLAAVLATVTANADRQYSLCDPIKSKLCLGLTGVFEFDEASDSARTSEVPGGPRFIEPDGANVANDTTNKKTGAASLSHTAVANSYVYIPRTSGIASKHTTAFWLRVTTNPSASGKR